MAAINPVGGDGRPNSWPFVVKERKGSGKITFSKSGIVGHRIYEVKWVKEVALPAQGGGGPGVPPAPNDPNGAPPQIVIPNQLFLLGGADDVDVNAAQNIQGAFPNGPGINIDNPCQPPAGQLPFQLPPNPGFYTWIDFVQRLLGHAVINPATCRPIITRPDVFSTEFYWLYCQECQVHGENEVGFEGQVDFFRRPALANNCPRWPSAPGYSPADGQLPVFYGQQGTDKQHGTPISPRIQYENAIIEAKYAPYSLKNSINMSGQSHSLEGSNFAWTGSTDNPNADPDLKDPSAKLKTPLQGITQMAEIHIERHQILVPNMLGFLYLVGRMNRQPFLDKPARTLVLMSATGSEATMPNGVPCWDMNFKFAYNSHEWPKTLRPSVGGGNVYQYVKDISAATVNPGKDFGFAVEYDQLNPGEPGYIQNQGPLILLAQKNGFNIINDYL